MGMVTITWEMTSGGVMMAAKINITTTACLRYLTKNSGVNKPIFTSKYVTTGNKKNNPV